MLPVDAKTELYGILGDPIEHSLSPILHNAVFQALKINAVYLAFRVSKQNLELAFLSLRSMGIRGVNVTIPHKEAALNFVDEIPEDVDRCAGAINTVVNQGGKLYGFNTDGPGFLAAVKEELSFDPLGKTVLLLGAGGAARGVSFALAHAEADRILILNRDKARAEGLKDLLAGHFPDTDIESLEGPEAVRGEKIDLVVNATSCGMHAGDPLPLDLRLLKSKAGVVDLVYSPSPTPFLKAARNMGLASANGLGMLAAQAALSFKLWTGKEKGVRDTMREALKRCCL